MYEQLLVPGLFLSCFELLLCFICLLCASTWRQRGIALLALPASIIGCFWLCTVCHTGIGIVISGLVHLFVLSVFVKHIDEYTNLKRKTSPYN